MKYDYEILENITFADLAYRVSAVTVEEMFIKGAGALMSEMLQDISLINRDVTENIIIEEKNIELLYHAFLDEFLFYKDAENLILLPDNISISINADSCILHCSASGEKIDNIKHHFNTDIKAVTMHKLRVERKEGGWFAEIVLDV